MKQKSWDSRKQPTFRARALNHSCLLQIICHQIRLRSCSNCTLRPQQSLTIAPSAAWLWFHVRASVWKEGWTDLQQQFQLSRKISNWRILQCFAGRWSMATFKTLLAHGLKSGDCTFLAFFSGRDVERKTTQREGNVK